ncbi:hypothetical protein J5N97_022922 [Dioscorea zingiberensis]|uniref:E2F-associated phosphoprotein n=1 Tax=Dioscorea zingiberensis TaxID=325984 RepID=A0A9D5CCX0_9LILI|nr:hypothetical protein J5N97_022922 [Dioscorea zingiberensis]
MEDGRGKEVVEPKPEDMDQEPEAMDPQELDELWDCVSKGKKGHSDAVLSCPACFTTLCLDCQRHAEYVTQFRAMFVTNCEIKSDKLPPQQKVKQMKLKNHSKSRGNPQEDTETDDDAYRQVCCSVCSTQVGIIDKNEVYHFFHVLPSYT